MTMIFSVNYVPRNSRFHNLINKTGYIIKSNEYRSLFQPISLNGKPDGEAVWLPKDYFELNDDPKWEKAYELYQEWKMLALSSLHEDIERRELIIQQLAEKYGLTTDNIMDITTVVSSL